MSDFSEERLEEIRQQILEGARWHFPASGDGTVYPGSSDASEFMNQGIDKCDLQLFSEGIHTFQDSWSHQGRPVDGNIGMGHGRGVWNIFGIYIGIPSGFLTMISTSTDDPDLFGADVHDMADDLYKKFLEFAQNCPCACGGKPYNKPKKLTDDLIPYDNRNVVDFDPVTNTYR